MEPIEGKEIVGVQEDSNNYTKMSSFQEGYPIVAFCPEKLYVDRFKLIPSAKYVRFYMNDDRTEFDFKSINGEVLKAAYLKTDFCKDSGADVDSIDVIERISRSTFAENKGGKRVKKTTYNTAYVNDRCVDSSMTLIDNLNRIIFTFDNCSMEVYYPSTKADVDGVFYKLCDQLWKFIPTKDSKEKSKAEIELITYANRRLDTTTGEIEATTIDVNKTYNDDFKDVYKKINDFVNDEEKGCGIVILNGEPGTGKTTFIRDIVTHSKKKFLFISPELANNISSPDFTQLLLENANSVLIMEDCEKAIEKRSDGGFMSSVASILNMSDGLLGDIYNIRFICTFNSDLERVDDALLRKGRCKAMYTFKKLAKEKATAILKERGFDVVADEDMSLADIFHYGEDNGVETSEKRKIGF